MQRRQRRAGWWQSPQGQGLPQGPPVSSLPPPSGGRCDACGAQAGGAERGDAAPAHGKRPWPRQGPRRGVLGPGPRDQALGRGGWDWRGSKQRGRGQALCPEPCCTWRAGAAAGRRMSASGVSGGVHGVLLGVWIFASLRSERRHLSVSHCALVKTEHLVRISLSRRRVPAPPGTLRGGEASLPPVAAVQVPPPPDPPFRTSLVVLVMCRMLNFVFTQSSALIFHTSGPRARVAAASVTEGKAEWVWSPPGVCAALSCVTTSLEVGGVQGDSTLS